MYKNINFPEGTNAINATNCLVDMFDSTYKFNNTTLDCEIRDQTSTPQVFFRGYKPFYYFKNGIQRYQVGAYGGFIPSIDLSLVTSFSITTDNKQMWVLEGALDKLESISANQTKDIIFYYPTGQTIKVLANSFPNNKIIPYGDVPVKLRVLKDGAWMDGSESILYDGVEMNYKGGGLYEITKTVLPRKRFNFPITIGEYFIKSPDVSDTESVIYLGDNSGNITTIEGADILNYATDNSNGWFFDETNNGIANNDIGNNGSTTLTLSIPSPTIDIVYGQSSENKYDYMTVLDADGKVIFTAKEIDGTDKTATITNNSNTYVFKYSKDGSGDNGTDSCWINSITCNQLPDYPNN